MVALMAAPEDGGHRGDGDSLNVCTACPRVCWGLVLRGWEGRSEGAEPPYTHKTTHAHTHTHTHTHHHHHHRTHPQSNGELALVVTDIESSTELSNQDPHAFQQVRPKAPLLYTWQRACGNTMASCVLGAGQLHFTPHTGHC